MSQKLQIVAVQCANAQHSKCNRDLDTQVQPPQGTLNTRLAYAVCATASCGSSPPRLNSLGGSFPSPSLNRETASCHSGAGTWVAPLRGMLPVGYARTSQLTGQQEKENVRALNAGNDCLQTITMPNRKWRIEKESEQTEIGLCLLYFVSTQSLAVFLLLSFSLGSWRASSFFGGLVSVFSVLCFSFYGSYALNSHLNV